MLRESGEKGRKVGGRVVVSLSGSFETTDKPLSCLGTHTNFTVGHLFCTLISENQGLDKLRSVSNLRKISGPAHLNFFSVHLSFFFSLSPEFFSNLYHKPEKIQVTN